MSWKDQRLIYMNEATHEYLDDDGEIIQSKNIYDKSISFACENKISVIEES